MTVTFDLRPEELEEDETSLLLRDPVLMQRITAIEQGTTQLVDFPGEMLADV